ncbi:hypothetical protein [Paenibacillus macquariensis]|uniref:hypothetical protein n=1 Tax=Paenibacillus macquariensis TaxID=948756 RepID=UPI00147267B9|nr:hypothetical protein [Paenibacillus macquariensis]MEC0092955.1 hypothetical protein [Paenibacillus macquariensis]
MLSIWSLNRGYTEGVSGKQANISQLRVRMLFSSENHTMKQVETAAKSFSKDDTVSAEI